MRLLQTVFLIFSLSTSVYAQSTSGTVSGSVRDGTSEEPLASATVALHLASDSVIVTGTMTDSDGAFEIDNVRAGNYFLRVSFVGYHPEVVSEVTISQSNPQVDIGVVNLRVDTAELEEVEISAEREFMEIGVDRTTYHVQNQPVTAGASAREVLENIPSVEVDIDGNISLRGSQGVTVFINGRPAPMSGDALTSFLEGLASEDIERVEVIPNPSARYDPSGMSGILNIVLGKGANLGWGGSLSSNVNTRGSYGASLSGHYGKGPWRTHSNYSLRYSNWDRNGWRFRENRFLDPLTFLEQDMFGERGGLSHFFRTSVDYNFDEKNVLSMSGMFSHRGNNSDQINYYDELDAGKNLTHSYSRSSDANGTDFNLDFELSFERIMKPREHELSIEVQFDDERESEFERFINRTLPLGNRDAQGEIAEMQDIDETARERQASIEVDYMRALGERTRLELGYEGEQEWVDETFYSESMNEAGDFVPDLDLNNTFTYKEIHHSAYGIIQRKFGKFGAQMGVRLEQALTNFDLKTMGETFENSYLSIFPSAHLSYEISQRNTLRASYSKRVRRPNEWQLNPFGDYDDPTSIRMGNPYLTPEYTHSTELSYSHLGDEFTITFSPYFRYSVDEISWHERITEEGVTILTFENFDTEQSYGAELVGSLTLGSWLKGNASINAYKRSTQAGSLSSELSNDALGYRTRMSATVEVAPGLQLQVSQSYRSPMNIPGGRIDANLQTDFALQKDVLSGRGSLNLRARDLFGSPNELIQRDMERYYQEFFQERNSRSVQVSFRYNFNGNSGRGDGGGRGGRGYRGGRD